VAPAISHCGARCAYLNAAPPAPRNTVRILRAGSTFGRLRFPHLHRGGQRDDLPACRRGSAHTLPPAPLPHTHTRRLLGPMDDGRDDERALVTHYHFKCTSRWFRQNAAYHRHQLMVARAYELYRAASTRALFEQRSATVLAILQRIWLAAVPTRYVQSAKDISIFYRLAAGDACNGVAKQAHPAYGYIGSVTRRIPTMTPWQPRLAAARHQHQRRIVTSVERCAARAARRAARTAQVCR